MAGGSNNTSCAVMNDGKVYCWGDLTWIVNNGTQLFTGYAQAITTDGTTPLTGVDQVALGPRDACALVEGAASKEVWCWGTSQSGESGQGTTTMQQYPKKVLGFTSPSYLVLAAGDQTYNATPCVLDGDGVRCWGSNSYGASGVNSAANPTLSPTPRLPGARSLAC